jgi:transketolase
MRNAFATSVTRLAAKDSNIVLLAGDIGNRLFDEYKENFPSRFYNCGVAEASMTGLASGLASSGLKPITYTITPFNTLRCLEQIRVDICYPDLPVIIVGTGSGISYANLGVTHHSLEDIAIMRVLPNMNVLAPADSIEVDLALEAALKLGKPTYIRIGKKGEPVIHTQNPNFEIGQAITLHKGKDIALVGVGTMVSVAEECRKLLESEGRNPSLISLHSIKPLDEELLKELFSNFKTIVVIEEHGLAGGAGSAILEWGNQKKVDLTKLNCFGSPDRFLMSEGNQLEARQSIGLDALSITNKLKQI